jgi:tyrosyl-tRNA synthetase
MAAQIVMTLPLLEGTDGVQKMSKSLGNYVGVTEPADEIFGKIMSISDTLMLRWYDVLESGRAGDVRAGLNAGRLHPREAKAQLAGSQVRRFHGESAALEARRRFDERFVKRELSADIVPEERIDGGAPAELALPAFLTEKGLTKSNSDARRLIGQGAVRINGTVVLTERYRAETDASGGLLVEVGKRRARRFRYSG